MASSLNKICVILATILHSTSAMVHDDWGYHIGVHPDRWGYLYPTCNGEKQSPIDIKTDDVVYDKHLQKLDLRDLKNIRGVKMDLHNNGHTVQVDLSGKKERVYGGSLPGKYTVAQFHFHWGSQDMRGSEHEINGKHFAMEMHIVMYNSDKFRSVKEAMNTTNGLAVLGVIVDVGKHNKHFDSIIKMLKKIQHKDDHVIVKTFSLVDLLPSNKCYYRYYGSLTTPPCFESVIWSIFKEHIYLSEAQLNQFRALGKTHFEHHEDLINNYRNPQPLKGRVVKTNCGYHGDKEREKNEENGSCDDSSTESSTERSDTEKDYRGVHVSGDGNGWHEA